MRKRKRALLNAILREDFRAFVDLAFRIVHPGQSLRANWHIDAMCWALQEASQGDTTRQMITIGPRHLKSFVTSVAFPAWLLGNDPSLKIICASYSSELSLAHAGLFRTLVESAEYRRYFPKMRFSARRNNEKEQMTTQGGYRLAASIDGSLRGRGGAYLIIDDPLKGELTPSDAEREKAWNWFTGVATSRLDNPRTGVMIIVTQRTHEDDLVGRLLAQPDHGWRVLNIPAIATEDTTFKTGARPTDIVHRRAGSPIDPNSLDLDDLDLLRRQMGSAAFAAQYQQDPIASDANIIRRSWIRTYETVPERPEVHAIIQSWDTAFGIEEANDYSVCTTLAVTAGAIYLIDIVRLQLEFPGLITMDRTHMDNFEADYVLIEQAGSGQSLIQSLKADRTRNQRITGIKPTTDKVSRLTSVSHMIEKGTVRFPLDIPNLDVFMRELLGFPNGRYDDCVDSLSQALNWLRTKRAGSLQSDIGGRPQRRRLRERATPGQTLGKPLPPALTYGTLPAANDTEE